MYNRLIKQRKENKKMTKIENCLGVGYDVSEDELREALELLYQKREREREEKEREIKTTERVLKQWCESWEHSHPNVKISFTVE